MAAAACCELRVGPALPCAANLCSLARFDAFIRRALLDGPDPRIFSCSASGDVVGLRQLFEEDPEHDTGTERRGEEGNWWRVLESGSAGAGGADSRACITFLSPSDAPPLADVFNADGVAPLHLAARGGHLGACAFLLQKGSFVDMQDWDVSGSTGSWLAGWAV